jgi:hypothetical protein
VSQKLKSLLLTNANLDKIHILQKELLQDTGTRVKQNATKTHVKPLPGRGVGR